jgi:hypothetical protein
VFCARDFHQSSRHPSVGHSICGKIITVYGMIIHQGLVCHSEGDECDNNANINTSHSILDESLEVPALVGNVTLGGFEQFSVIDTTFGLIQKTLFLAPNGFKAVIFLFDGRITD